MDPRGTKRSYAESVATSTPWSTGSTPVGSPDTRQRKNKRRRLKDFAHKLEEDAFRKRYNHFSYLGYQGAHRKLDNEPSFSNPCFYFTQYMATNPLPLPDFDPEAFRFVKTNSLVQLNHLDRFNRPTHRLPEESREFVALAASYVEHLLTLDEQIPFPSKADLADVPFIGDKFAGIDYARQGYKTRREADSSAQLDAEAAWDQLMAGERVEPHLNRIGGRGKLATKTVIDDSGKKLDKGRLVMMTSQRDLKLNGVVEKLLTDAYRSPQYPIAVGQSWWHGGCEVFLERFRRFSRYWCFDAKKFDASLPGWLIRLAIGIFRRQFVNGEDQMYDAYWEFVYEGLVEAPMFLDNGFVFRRFDGSTSGHNLNSLMQSVCTLIIFYTCIAEFAGLDRVEEAFENVWCEGMGDDEVGAAVGPEAEHTKGKFAEATNRIFGIDWSGAKSFETDMLVDELPGAFQGLQFLGKYFRLVNIVENDFPFEGVIPYRPSKETFERLLYPEHETDTANGAWERAVGHYADAAGNDVTRGYLEKYLDWLEPQISSREVSFSEKTLRKLTGGAPFDEIPIPARRITYEEWLRLTLDSL